MTVENLCHLKTALEGNISLALSNKTKQTSSEPVLMLLSLVLAKKVLPLLVRYQLKNVPKSESEMKALL